MNSEYSQKLGELREEIDKIDDKILKLLQKRLEIVKSVQEVKSKNGEEFFIKSAREADMIKNLLTKTKIMPKSAIIDIWRKIITSANCLEQPLQIALHNPNHITDFKYILRQYYADFVPIINQNNIADVIFDIEKNKSQIAVFALPNNDSDNICDNWWIHMCNNKAGLKVFARIPFIPQENSINLVALAKKPQEKSQKDRSLLCIETTHETSKSAVLTILKDIEISANILKTSRIKSIGNALFHLVELDGYFDENSQEIEHLQKKHRFFVNVLGCYAA